MPFDLKPINKNKLLYSSNNLTMGSIILPLVKSVGLHGDVSSTLHTE